MRDLPPGRAVTLFSRSSRICEWIGDVGILRRNAGKVEKRKAGISQGLIPTTSDLLWRQQCSRWRRVIRKMSHLLQEPWSHYFRYQCQERLNSVPCNRIRCMHDNHHVWVFFLLLLLGFFFPILLSSEAIFGQQALKMAKVLTVLSWFEEWKFCLNFSLDFFVVLSFSCF